MATLANLSLKLANCIQVHDMWPLCPLLRIKALKVLRVNFFFLISASQALNSLTLKTDWKTNSIIDDQTDALPRISKTV